MNSELQNVADRFRIRPFSPPSPTQKPEPGRGLRHHGGGNTLWALRASFEIQHLRRLSRGSADPREHSRSWGLAQSCPAHVAAPWCCRPLPGSSPFATIFFSTYPHYPHIYPHPQFPPLWIPLCITLFT